MGRQISPPAFQRQSSAVVSAEADHRIANSLAVIASLVRVRASKVNGAADPRTFLLEIADRIDTVGKLHTVFGELIGLFLADKDFLIELPGRACCPNTLDNDFLPVLCQIP